MSEFLETIDYSAYTGKRLPGISMITSRLTDKGQTTIPLSVRRALSLREGDEIAYSIDGDVVTVRKAPPTAIEDPFDTFTEWDGDADRKAYRHL